MHDQGTYAPADGLNRWMPSAAMDKSGDIAVGYSTLERDCAELSEHHVRGAPRDRPARRARHRASTLYAGTGSQTGTASRWGDYSGMSVDPVDDCTFWYTTEYIQTTGATPWRTRDRLVQVPVVRPAAGPAAATSAATTSASTAASTASARATTSTRRRPASRSSPARPTSASTATTAGAT